MANEPKPQLKRGRPLGSKDTIPRKRKNVKFNTPEEDAPEEHTNEKGLTNINNELIAPAEASIDQLSHEFVSVNNNEEISINYIHKGKIWNRNTTLIDDAFSFQVATDIINNDEDQEPQNIDECRRRNDWLKWKEAIQTELKSLAKREVFGPVVQTPKDIKPIGYRWVFVRKRNEQNKIVRYKARLVAQGFSQRPGIDYEETYSPVMDATTFRYLIYLAVSEGLDMRLMDVVTTYLYGSLDTNVYMKIPEGFKLPEVMNSKPQSIYSVKLQRSLYGLKQSGRMWYNRLSHYLLKEGYVNNSICPCVFIKKVATEFAIIAVYVDDLNLIGTPEELIKTVDYLKKEFEMKDLGKTKYCLGLQIEYFSNGIFVHQSTYTEKVLKRFYMDKTHPLNSPMIVRSLEVDKDPFRPKEENEKLFGPEVPYLSAIGALRYLANCTRPGYSSAPTLRHWNEVKHLLRYLRGTSDMGLFYFKVPKLELLGYTDAGYLSDPHKARSQSGYVFTCGNTTISWRSVKQTMVATSSNHSELLALNEASRECMWLRSMIQHIRDSSGLSPISNTTTTLYEDNAACIAQLKGVYIKGDRTKHISPKFFYTHELQNNGEINIQQIRYSDNPADLFTKALPATTFKKFLRQIGMRRLKDLHTEILRHQGER